MLKSFLITLCVLCVLMPGAAMAKKYRPNDNSTNNTCKFVHDWYLHVKVKHAVFVTTGGSAYGASFKRPRICQAGQGPSVAAAANYAIKRCEKFGKKRGDHRRCKVVESR
jgi:hypothetical protein